MRISAIDRTAFNGIYKIKASKNEGENHRVERFLSESSQVHKISMPFEDEKNGRTYFYAVTRGDHEEEKEFENGLMKAQIPYWKAAPLRHIGDKKLFDHIFDNDKMMQGKESWVRPQPQQK